MRKGKEDCDNEKSQDSTVADPSNLHDQLRIKKKRRIMYFASIQCRDPFLIFDEINGEEKYGTSTWLKMKALVERRKLHRANISCNQGQPAPNPMPEAPHPDIVIDNEDGEREHVRSESSLRLNLDKEELCVHCQLPRHYLGVVHTCQGIVSTRSIELLTIQNDSNRANISCNQGQPAPNPMPEAPHPDIVIVNEDGEREPVRSESSLRLNLDKEELCVHCQLPRHYLGVVHTCQGTVSTRSIELLTIQNDSEHNDVMCKTKTEKDKGVYIGVGDDDMASEDDELVDIWKEMAVGLESFKDNIAHPSSDDNPRRQEEVCDHSFILKDDIGYVCRVCGMIERAIETIIEYQYAKATPRTTRYRYDEAQMDDVYAKTSKVGLESTEHDIILGDVFIHPSHAKQMKPHQVEGFNFLVSNLMSKNPGGCILAHAPGSGKTFMIISFLQSFLAKYPEARPLIVLPKGILATWKKEFITWQVENLPLYDFYSTKADNRSQQLQVLKNWAGQKSILFLGYKQFSSIVCDYEKSEATTACQKVLLTRPSIIIMDEGHTPRTEDTDVFMSLRRVQTPRKVVLSGTLYQNNVKEVFNIIDLVRPKFLNSDSSRDLMRRIFSRIPRARNLKKNGFKNVFCDSVECSIQNKEDFKIKGIIIQDLRELTKKILHYYKGDFLDELPGLLDFTVFLKLSKEQKNEIDMLKKSAGKFAINSIGSSLYVHPKLKALKCKEKDELSDEKIDNILEDMDLRDGVKGMFFLTLLGLCESADEKLLVFSQFLPPLKFLERLTIKEKGWSVGKQIFGITGDSSNEMREFSTERFNASIDARVFFGSIKACGEGISLVGASRIIVLDVHLNPSVIRQAIGRAFRPGQKKKVFVYRLIARDSPEEEDHTTCFRKESIAKMWFEWMEYDNRPHFEMERLQVSDCGDTFLELPKLNEDVEELYKR